MLKSFVILLLAFAAINVSADVFKCKGPDGKIQFSDTPCKAGNASHVVPDRAPVTDQQRYEAQQRGVQMQNEAAALDAEKAAAISTHQASQQRQAAEAQQREAAAKVVSSDADAINACVRDVERRGATQNVKAEMIAACRTAGFAQRSTGLSGDIVSDCVKRVERTGASEKEKVRQLALCHGADVQPEIYSPRRPAEVVPSRQAVITKCSGPICTDEQGNRYTTAAGKTVRSDGKRCYQQGTMLYCDQ